MLVCMTEITVSISQNGNFLSLSIKKTEIFLKAVKARNLIEKIRLFDYKVQLCNLRGGSRSVRREERKEERKKESK